MHLRTVVRLILAGIVTVMFGIAAFLVISHGQSVYILLVLGALIAAFTMVVSFYFGSSEGA